MAESLQPTVALALIAARNEEDRIAATVSGLLSAFAVERIVVADDGSDDGTASVALAAGAEVVSTGAHLGKGGAMSLAAARGLALLDAGPARPGAGDGVALLCDADLTDSAARLSPLVATVARGEADLAIAAFAARVGGGFGVALRFARWAIERRCGYRAGAPISGQRALSVAALRAVTPFAPGYGMEIGMTVTAVRAGLTVRELELDLEHRATGRTFNGFVHRGRQLRDFTRTYRALGRKVDARVGGAGGR